MIKLLSPTIDKIIEMTWPMVLISCIIFVSLRISYLHKRHERIIIYKELLLLTFIIYIMCLFQVVTFQDDTPWASNNFIPFKEILRYNMGSRLFFKNVVGNLIMFIPYGFFTSYYLDNKKISLTLVLTIIASISIESVQLIIGRVFDVDDIILNILGGICGYLIYHVFDLIASKLPKIFRNEVILDILTILILIIFVVILF